MEWNQDGDKAAMALRQFHLHGRFWVYDIRMVAATKIAIENVSQEVSRLVDSVRTGQEIVITRGGCPVAKIVSMASSMHRPVAGYGRGTVSQMADDFDEPMSEFEEGI